MHTFLYLKPSATIRNEVPDVGLGLTFQLLISNMTNSILGMRRLDLSKLRTKFFNCF